MVPTDSTWQTGHPYESPALQRVACERYRSQTVSVNRIVVSGFTPTTH